MLNNKTLALGAAFAAGLSLSTAALAKDAQLAPPQCKRVTSSPAKTPKANVAAKANAALRKKTKKRREKEGEGKCGANMKKRRRR